MGPPRNLDLHAMLTNPPHHAMLFLAAAPWLLLCVGGTVTVPFLSMVLWLWAIKNRIYGPLTTDLGVFTHALSALAFLSSYTWLKVVASSVLAMHFGLPALICLQSTAQQISQGIYDKFGHTRTAEWSSSFRIFLVSFSLYFVVLAVMSLTM